MMCRAHDYYSCSNCPNICPKCSAQRSTPHYQENYHGTVTTSATATGPPRHRILPSSESPHPNYSTSFTDRAFRGFDQHEYPHSAYHQRAQDPLASPPQASASITGQKLPSPDDERKRRRIPIPGTGRHDAHNAYPGIDPLRGCPSPSPKIDYYVDRIECPHGFDTRLAVRTTYSPIFTTS